MHTLPFVSPPSSARQGLASLLSAVSVSGGRDPHAQANSDRQFVRMLRAFRAHGGLARGDEVVTSARAASAQTDPLALARRLATREVLSFPWRQDLWVPLFQFEGPDLRVKDAVRKVLDELVAAFDAWSVAHWFAAPNGWLQGRVPVTAMEGDPHAVWQSARADRFIVMG